MFFNLIQFLLTLLAGCFKLGRDEKDQWLEHRVKNEVSSLSLIWYVHVFLKKFKIDKIQNFSAPEKLCQLNKYSCFFKMKRFFSKYIDELDE